MDAHRTRPNLSPQEAMSEAAVEMKRRLIAWMGSEGRYAMFPTVKNQIDVIMSDVLEEQAEEIAEANRNMLEDYYLRHKLQ